jgi:3alpha(or 20beta)-hydroxysteroid dehydrogenase
VSGKLADRVVLVTGGARGQGRGIAERFIAEGACVVLADVNDDAGRAAAAELGDRALFAHLDVADEGDWARAVEAAVEHFGKLDGLVNNAGIFKWAPLESTSLEDWNAVISVCQTGVFLGMRAVVGPMKAAGGGTIVNTSSTSGIWALPQIVSYVAAKFAVRGMTKVAAIELGPHNIRVNSVCPGGIETPMSKGNHSSGWQAASASGFAFVPLGRRGTPAEIGNLMLFLTSDDSSYCTGGDFVCDGGMLAGPSRRD